MLYTYSYYVLYTNFIIMCDSTQRGSQRAHAV